MMDRWLFVTLNPEPWAVGPLGVMRQGGKLKPFMGRNQQLHSYKEAVKEELVERYGELLPTSEEIELFCYFWQRLDDYESVSGRKTRDRGADLTNLVKATEDAIQKLLIKNDNQVRAQRTVIFQQGPGITNTGVIIRIRSWTGMDPSEVPDNIWADFNQANAGQVPDSPPTWPDNLLDLDAF